ncbi:MAG: hypothetical protein AVDCRST_MAG19-150 [uncultured Thermomicrobiales bacterium]|uniref:Uncharacterized protein n=1 Tax=uncultured Thermomicrobiales bacterium TaxID=1645740 RepID=A0A6J4UBN3_9BACT|nr:MAG: hypothetical protein AVDCRST_MAG19-150 [uncultured Thermomicrobiales bacterium]
MQQAVSLVGRYRPKVPGDLTAVAWFAILPVVATRSTVAIRAPAMVVVAADEEVAV